MRLTIPAMAALAVAAAGCDFNGPTQEPLSKLRHAHLLEDARQSGRTAGKRDNALGLIVSMKPGAVVRRYRVLERYKVLERYQTSARFEYQEAFSGFALTIEDTTGGTDFSAILRALQDDADIAWMEPDFDVESVPSLPEHSHAGQRIPWSVAMAGGQESSAISGDGQGAVPVPVYVLDTGISNPDLNVVEALDFRGDLIADPADHDGHGTHVAGILAAVDDADGLVGIAPGALVHNYKVLGDDGTADVSVVIAAVEHLIDLRRTDPDRPMVVNLSLGEYIGSESPTALDEAVATLAAAGAVVVVAAGNQAVDASHVTPAHVADVITVGAHDADGVLAPYSNFGSVIDLLAPGTGIVSLAPSVSDSGAPARMTGTSMAAPHVAGAAALYLWANPRATPSEVRSALVAAARPGIRVHGGTTDRALYVADF
ncbi:MAG: S8 family serine peptidase [Rhodothermales bacterium]|nr:S8 family serine peptidase [Rhodothermales bacterium]MBO6781312.1 S8 family serine peptidase [Rhodothermales bacterium]